MRSRGRYLKHMKRIKVSVALMPLNQHQADEGAVLAMQGDAVGRGQQHERIIPGSIIQRESCGVPICSSRALECAVIDLGIKWYSKDPVDLRQQFFAAENAALPGKCS